MNDSTKAANVYLAGLTAKAAERCRGALLEVRKLLPYAPIEHSSRWYELASRPERVKQQFLEAEMMRSALAAAKAEGPEAFQFTKAAVHACFAQMEAEVMRGFEGPSIACRVQGAAVLVKELNDAATASVQFAASPSAAARHQAAIEVEEANDALDGFRRFLALQSMDHRQPMSA